MTDNEILKALEWFVRCNEKHVENCDGCPLHKEYPYCDENIAKDALDLINRQKAEIERLHSILLSFTNEVSTWSNRKGYDTTELSLIPILNESKRILTDIKAEAVKEFAERLKEKKRFAYAHLGKTHYTVYEEDIDELVQEMVGDE